MSTERKAETLGIFRRNGTDYHNLLINKGESIGLDNVWLLRDSNQLQPGVISIDLAYKRHNKWNTWSLRYQLTDQGWEYAHGAEVEGKPIPLTRTNSQKIQWLVNELAKKDFKDWKLTPECRIYPNKNQESLNEYNYSSVKETLDLKDVKTPKEAKKLIIDSKDNKASIDEKKPAFEHKEMKAPKEENKFAFDRKETKTPKEEKKSELKEAKKPAVKREFNEDTWVPEAVICPLTRKIIQDPATTILGSTYERAAIEDYLRTHNDDPATGKKISNKILVTNYLLKTLIEDTLAYNNAKEYGEKIKKLNEIPDRFEDSISRSSMSAPVLNIAGQTYDNESILEWYLHQEQKITDPLTGVSLKNQTLIPNKAVKDFMSEHLEYKAFLDIKLKEAEQRKAEALKNQSIFSETKEDPDQPEKDDERLYHNKPPQIF